MQMPYQVDSRRFNPLVLAATPLLCLAENNTATKTTESSLFGH
jgi:hypothetical protein